MKPYDVFICYKKNSGKDFAEHLEVGLEELGLRSFIDRNDISQMVDGKEEWAKTINRAIEDSKIFVLIMTPGFELSIEIIDELKMARRIGNKEFIYFRHRNLSRKIVIDLETEKLDIGKQQQVSFETKEELLRLAHNILIKSRFSAVSPFGTHLVPSISGESISSNAEKGSTTRDNSDSECPLCSNPIYGKAYVAVIGNKKLNFDSRGCASTYRKLKLLYGPFFEETIKNSRNSKSVNIRNKVIVTDDHVRVFNKQGRNKKAVSRREETQIPDQFKTQFSLVTLEANLIAPRKVVVGEKFEIRLVLINSSRKPLFLVKAEDLIPSEFEVTSPPALYIIENGSVKMENRKIVPLQVETIKLTLRALKADTFSLRTQVSYIDEIGESKTCESNTVTITVQPAQSKYEVLPGRKTTGYKELDALLFGGIPQNYAVALASPLTDEREQLTRRFLEAGATLGETTFFITTKVVNSKAMVEKYPSNFFLLVCNPQADGMIQSLPNVFKLKGVENLTDIDIALTKALRTLNLSTDVPKRICIDILSDALLQHHAVTTRKWLNALLTTLKSKGFTILAVVDPQMHPPEETHALLGLFDGEISILEKETPNGPARFLKVKRLNNQKYFKSETSLTWE